MDPPAKNLIDKRSYIPEAEFIDVNKAANMSSRNKEAGRFDRARPAYNNNFYSNTNDLSFDEFQKLVDAVAEHGTNNWILISKTVFNDAIAPQTLSAKWEEKVQKYGSNFWTTKEIKKLIDAVQSSGEDWAKISYEVFGNTRTPSQCENKWFRINGIKKWGGANRDYPQKDYSYSSQRGNFNLHAQRAPTEWTEEDTRILIEAVDKQGANWALIAEKYYAGKQTEWNLQAKWVSLVTTKFNEFLKTKDEMKHELPKEIGPDQRTAVLSKILGNQWSNFVHIFGQRFVKLDVNFVSPQELPWTKEENAKLFDAIRGYGFDWGKISKALPDRSEQVLRERLNGITSWTQDEMSKFVEAYRKHKENWEAVSADVGTKTSSECWTFWRASTGADILDPNTDKKSGMNHFL